MLRLQDMSALPPVFPSSFTATPPSNLFCSPLWDSSSKSVPPMKILQNALLHPALPSHMSRTVLQADQRSSWSSRWNTLPGPFHLDALSPESPPPKRQRASEYQRRISSREASEAAKRPCHSSLAFDPDQTREDHLDGPPSSSDTGSTALDTWSIPTHQETWPSGQHEDFSSDKSQRLGKGVVEEDAKMGEFSKAQIHEDTWLLPAPNWTDAEFNQARQHALNTQRKEGPHPAHKVHHQNLIHKLDSGFDPLAAVIKCTESNIRSDNTSSSASLDAGKDTRPDAWPFMTIYSSSEKHQYGDSPHSQDTSTSSRHFLRKRKARPSTFKMRLRSGRNAAANGKSEPNLSIGFHVAADTSLIAEETSWHDQEMPAPESNHSNSQSDGPAIATSGTTTSSNLNKVQTVDTKTLGRRPRRRPQDLLVVDPNKSSDYPLAGLTSKVLRDISLQHLYPRLFATRVACDTSPSSSARTSRAVFNSPRSDSDLYTPRWTKGTGGEKVGLCPICMPQYELWQKMKCSAYWYHLHYHHGVSAQTGAVFPAPEQIEFQDLGFLKSIQNNLQWNESRLLLSSTLPTTGQHSNDPQVSFGTGNDSHKLNRRAVEEMISEPESPGCLKIFETALTHLDMIPAGLCGSCSKWIPLDSLLRESGGIQEIPWWKHTQQCQKAPRVASRSRSKGIKKDAHQSGQE